MAASGGKKKGKMGLIIGLVLLVLFASAGAVVGLAMTGKINIPGLTPKKKTIAPLAPGKDEKKTKPKAPVKKDKPVEPAAPKPTSKIVDKVGAVKLAEVWNEMPGDKLLKVVEKWEPAELAIVLNEMDSVKSAELLALMKPDVASKVSQELKLVASQVPIEAP